MIPGSRTDRLDKLSQLRSRNTRERSSRPHLRTQRIRMTSRTQLCPVLLLVSLGTACGSQEQVVVEPPPVVRTWTLAMDAHDTLGSFEGEVLLDRVQDARFLDGGSFAVTNNRTEILIDDRSGSPPRRAGRGGQGPGEFQALRWIEPLEGGQIAGVDRFDGRVTVFDSLGRYVEFFRFETRRLDWESGVAYAGSGVFLTLKIPVFPERSRNTTVIQPLVGQGEIWLMSEDRDIALVGEISGTTRLYTQTGYRIGPMTTPPSLSRFGDRVAFTNGNGTIQIVDREGGRDSIDAGHSPRPVTMSMRDDYQEAARLSYEAAGMPWYGTLFPETWGGQEWWPETLPVHQRIRGDFDGCLWAQIYPEPLAATREWEVYNSRAQRIATLKLDRSLNFMDARGDEILVMHTDDFGVQTIRAYRLEGIDGSSRCA